MEIIGSTSDCLSTMALVLQDFFNYLVDQIYIYLFYLLSQFGENVETKICKKSEKRLVCKKSN